MSHPTCTTSWVGKGYFGTVTTTTPTLAARSRTSTILLKLLMAGTGLVFIGYVLLHMYGNLKVFAGQESFDTYAEHLREFGEPILPYSGLLWIIRVVLLGSLIVHAYCAFTLWSRAHGARTQKYAVTKRKHSTLSSKTMRWGGLALLLFVVFHILHFTTRTITPGGDSDSPYQRLVNGFSPEQWWWRWSTCSPWARWPCTCVTAPGARRRRSGSPAPRRRPSGPTPPATPSPS